MQLSSSATERPSQDKNTGFAKTVGTLTGERKVTSEWLVTRTIIVVLPIWPVTHLCKLKTMNFNAEAFQCKYF